MRYSTLLISCAAIVYVALRFLPLAVYTDQLHILIAFNLIPFLTGMVIAFFCSLIAGDNVGRPGNLRFSIDHWLIGSAIYLGTAILPPALALFLELWRQGWKVDAHDPKYSAFAVAVATRCETVMELGVGIIGSAYGRKMWRN